MIELPFEMKFELNLKNGLLKNNVLSALYETISNILPNPSIKINTNNENLANLLEFVEKLDNKYKCDIFIENPIVNKNFSKFLKFTSIIPYITDENFDFSQINFKTDIYFPVNISNNLYEFLKTIKSELVQKIYLIHTCENFKYDELLKQIELIKKDEYLSKCCHLIPYLEYDEQKIFYDKNNKKPIRPFLTCASLYLNPKINHNGEIDMPCVKLPSILENDFIDLWNNDKINDLREKLINSKGFEGCKYCLEFYKDNFLIVDGAKILFKNETLEFDDVLNYVNSAPIIALIKTEDSNKLKPVSLYSDNDIVKLNEKYSIIAILR